MKRKGKPKNRKYLPYAYMTNGPYTDYLRNNLKSKRKDR